MLLLFMFMNYDTLANAKGRYIEDEIYQVDKSAANEFDKRFLKGNYSWHSVTKRFDQI